MGPHWGFTGCPTHQERGLYVPRLLFLLFCKWIGCWDSNLKFGFILHAHEAAQKDSTSQVWPPNCQSLVPGCKSPVIYLDIRSLVPNESTWDLKRSKGQVLGPLLTPLVLDSLAMMLTKKKRKVIYSIPGIFMSTVSDLFLLFSGRQLLASSCCCGQSL